MYRALGIWLGVSLQIFSYGHAVGCAASRTRRVVTFVK